MRRLPISLAMLPLAACSGSPEGALPSSQKATTTEAVVGAEASTTPKVTSTETPAPKSSVACDQSEQTLFSCKIKGGKQLAVCGTNNNGGEPFAQYRFGKDRPELTINYSEFNNTAYSGGGESQIAFTNGETRYIVFSRVVRTNFKAGEPHNPEFQDGVMVVQPGKKVVTLRCDGEAENPVDLSNLGELGEAGGDIFYSED
ncbi:MAG: hypothetical protein WAT93_10880 [Pontixanthobacter sp.]